MNDRVPSDLRVRPAESSDVDRILELARLSLGVGDIPRERDFWLWKHVENPFGHSPVLLAEVDETLVGMRVFMRWKWQIGERTIPAVRAVDTATHPAWQGRGVFSRLTLALVEIVRDEGVELIFNTPNEKSRPGYLKMGWQSVGRMDLLISPVRPIALARAALRRGAGSPPTAPDPEPGWARAAAEAPLPESLDEVAWSSDAGTQSRLSTRRTREYLDWRYARNPAFRYWAAIEPHGAPIVCAFFRYRTRGPLVELRICDLIMDERSPRSISSVRKLVRRLQRVGGADYISVMASSGSRARKALLLAGFVPAPRLGPILTVRPLQAGSLQVDPSSRGAWSLSIGDLELF